MATPIHPIWFPKQPTWPAKLGRLRMIRLQRTLNKFTSTYMDGIAPLRVDGKVGQATRSRIRFVKYYIGMDGANRFSYKVSRQFVARVRKPNDASLVIAKTYSDKVNTVKRGQNRRQRHDKLYHESQHEYNGKPHWVTFDGKMIAAYIEPSLHWARYTGHNGLKWRGQVVSGGRTAAYSEHLCYVMCGHPSCPGKCAGRSSNHVGNDPYAIPCGAVDVSDYVRFKYLMQFCPVDKLHTVRLQNHLPLDPVHFSASGN